jgi:hypothetical protein
VDKIPVGRVVDYVVKTPFGNYCLPAQIFAQTHDDFYIMRVFSDDTIGSEWIVSAHYSERHESGTFHFRSEEQEEQDE